MSDYLETLLATLNSLEVRGKDNLNSLLGCILATERMIEQINRTSEDGEKDGRSDN